jgi:hypothetical protein
MSKLNLTGKRLTIRLTDEDEASLKSLARLLRQPWLDDVNITRTALREAERALSAEQSSRV